MLYFLINPSSRRKKSLRTWRSIEKDLKKEGIVYQAIITRSNEDVTDTAVRLTSDDEEKTLIILGGDGTLNAFLNGMIQTKGIQIGYLPMGSGNDFARGMGITTNYREEMDLILFDKQIRKIHYATVTYPSGKSRRFFVSAGMGYDARVCYQAEHSASKRLLNHFGLGRLVYLVFGVIGLVKEKTFPATLWVDGEPVLEGSRFIFTSFHMLPYEGGGFKFCPNVRPEDNLIHICAAEGIPKHRIPFIIPQAFVGTHVRRKGVHQFRCSQAEIVSGIPQYIHTDGETDYRYDSMKVRVSDDTITFLN